MLAHLRLHVRIVRENVRNATKNVKLATWILEKNVKRKKTLVVSVAQLVARRTHDRKVVGSIPTNAVCFTVVR